MIRNEERELVDGIAEAMISPADTVTVVFHPTEPQILVIYTQKDTPISTGRQMVFADLETALMFVRGIRPQPSVIGMEIRSDVPVEKKQEIGFLAKAA